MKKMADIMSKTGKWLLVFGFILSQLSFPLEVLAEELNNAESTNLVVEEATNVDMTNTTEEITPDDDIQTEEVVIKVNGVETLEYTTTKENTLVTISLEYQDETKNKVEEINFSERLYGVYEYTFEGIDKVVTIYHIGNNIDLVEKQMIDVTKEITCTLEECIIKGFGSEVVTVEDINTYFDFISFNTKYNVTTVITNEGHALIDTDTILNGYNLEIVGEEEIIDEKIENGKLVNITPKSIYTLNRVGDVFIPSDGIVNEKDQEAILDDILLDNELTVTNDLNSDGKLNILDATHSTFVDNIEVDVEDILTNTLTSSSEEILLHETLEVKLFISGFDKAMLYGIEGNLVYDNTILELVGATIYENPTEEESYLGYINEEGKFAYILNGFNLEDAAILTLEFEAIGVGETDITISDIIESYGEAFELANDSTSVSLTVANPEDNKGGDVEEELPKEDTTIKEEDTENEVEKEETEVVTKPVVRPVVLSSDYYLRNLTIEGYEIDFDMYTFEYSIKVASDVNSLNIKALLNNNNSIYYVEGNENFKEGENLVYVIVKAENGSTKTYTIKVEKEKAKEIVKDNDKEGNELDEEVEEEEKNSSKTVIIILIILVIIGLIYVIFKDDEEDTKETKKTAKSEKTDKVRIEEIKPEKVNTQKKNTSKKNTSSNKNTKKNTKKK